MTTKLTKEARANIIRDTLQDCDRLSEASIAADTRMAMLYAKATKYGATNKKKSRLYNDAATGQFAASTNYLTMMGRNVLTLYKMGYRFTQKK